MELIGDAGTLIAELRIQNGIKPAGAAFGVDAARIGASAGDLDWIDAQHRACIGGPAQRIGVETPFISDVADRPQNLRGVRDPGWPVNSGHLRTFLERRVAPGVGAMNSIRHQK